MRAQWTCQTTILFGVSLMLVVLLGACDDSGGIDTTGDSTGTDATADSTGTDSTADLAGTDTVIALDAEADVLPSCTDSMKNGIETDIDCGGICPLTCSEGASCAVAADCASGVCTTSICVCVAGFVADGLGECLDINECMLGTDNCSANANCTNTSGSFTCACNAGYSGDGVTCANDNYVTIPSGSFTMGSPATEFGHGSEEEQHTVTLTRSFEMKKTEVTQGEWQTLMGNNPSYFSSCGPNCPAEEVNWFEALAYANALSAAEGLAACYTLTGCTGTAGAGWNGMTSGMTCTGVTVNGGNPYACARNRLPTEAEWEYAYRAGTTTAFYNGGVAAQPLCDSADPNLNLEAIGWYCFNSNDMTHPVGQKQANGRGLYDMSGNVQEFCWDWSGAYTGAATDPAGPTGSGEFPIRAKRGGSWRDSSYLARAATRDQDSAPPNLRGYEVGFRLSRTLLP